MARTAHRAATVRERFHQSIPETLHLPSPANCSVSLVGQAPSPMPLSFHFAERLYELWGRLAACGGLVGRLVPEPQADSMREQRVQGTRADRGVRPTC
jgi:hypothetical protein